MSWDAGKSLFRDVWNVVEGTTCEEQIEWRMSFIAGLLKTFAEAGADIRELFGMDENVDATLKTLGYSCAEKVEESDPMETKLDLTRLEEPAAYELREGPYDGSSMRLATCIAELPPATITFEIDRQCSRGGARATYRFHNKQEFDRAGEFVNETIAYFFVHSAGSK